MRRLIFTECEIYLDGKHWYFIGTVLDISRKETVAQVGENAVSRCFAVVVVYVVTMQAMFGRPTRL